MDIAVIGAGISGLGAALKLQAQHRVVVFEGAPRAGGHANTVDVTLDGIRFPVDTGFLVYNERTYPGLIALFEELAVPVVPSDMSFAVSVGPHRHEWCGSNLRTLLAQPSNALRPGFWRMLRDILRFNREATALAQGGDAETLDRALGEHLERAGYSADFRDAYLLPMAAAIWSCPMRTMLGFPLGSFVRFFHNHGLLQVADRPQWYTVEGGSRQYVDRVRARLDELRLNCPVSAIRRPAPTEGGGVLVTSPRGIERFDQVVLACHSNQARALLTDADADERAVLDAIPYQPNTAWLHTDTRLMPRRRAAWAAWNYLSNGDADAPEVSVTYWLNRLQPLPFTTNVMVSLNPLTPPAEEHTIARLSYEHPVFDRGAMAAQKRLNGLQGRRATWFAGAWTGYGFHEDGLRSGLAVAGALNAMRVEPRAAA
ncbi:MAG TPA: FAD-dependent oxidoreductase [Quisquiliibacterium sp.]|nr:FAD-dependent oxidoreductase [Quisquiliibacterium sp.]